MNLNKFPFLLIILCFLIHKNYAQNTRMLFHKGILHGQVKSIKEYSINPDELGKPIDKDTVDKAIYTFNEKGDETSSHSYLHNPASKHLIANEEQAYTTVYDSKGNRLKTYWHTPLQKGLIKYNEKGKIAACDVYSFKTSEKSVSKYDENGDEIEFDQYLDNGTLKDQTILRNYRDAGNVIEVSQNANDSTKYKLVIKYTQDDYKPLEIDCYQHNGTTDYIIHYTYVTFDQHGNWTKQITHLDMEFNKAKIHKDVSVKLREITYY